jgi:U3 small nucleolar RNA-associated protein 10
MFLILLQEVPNVTPNAIRLDVLVELIRGKPMLFFFPAANRGIVAENPQTFHQALLLIASLARLAPDSVVHNVMPVFMFMGSNVFHRDDSYSFSVVQKVCMSETCVCRPADLYSTTQTIDSIVPVVVSSFKSQHLAHLDLYIGSKDFLRIFTDAANHIPRHRRTRFVDFDLENEVSLNSSQLFFASC